MKSRDSILVDRAYPQRKTNFPTGEQDSVEKHWFDALTQRARMSKMRGSLDTQQLQVYCNEKNISA